MASFDVESLLQPISPDSPSGANLEYEDEYAALEASAQGKAEQVVGEHTIPGEPPDWKEVRRIGLNLMERSKDLRIACMTARGLLETEGVGAFCDVLRVIRGYVETDWESVHPMLDPDDGNDPTWRVNTLASLNDFGTTLMSLRNAVLLDAGVLGRVSLRDIEVASGETAPDPDVDPPTSASIETAFQMAEAVELQATARALASGLEQLDAIESAITERVGAAQSLSFAKLREMLQKLSNAFENHIRRRGLEEAAEGTEAHDGESSGDPQVSADAVDEPAVADTPPARTDEIRSRQDVVRALDRICKYYENYEPSSPVPLLLRRAQRLASMSFLEIIEDLTPEGLSQAKSVGGVDDAEQPE